MNDISHPDTLDLAALLCSRICHDVINPVGAIVTGVEMLGEEQDEETRALALDLIAKSADQVSATLRFTRLAFGAATQAESEIDLAAVETAARGVLETGRITLLWHGARRPLDKARTKILLNLLMVGAACIPRGGRIAAEVSGESAAPRLAVTATGPNAAIPDGWDGILQGRLHQPLDVRAVQVYYTGRLVNAAGMEIVVATAGDTATLEVR